MFAYCLFFVSRSQDIDTVDNGKGQNAVLSSARSVIRINEYQLAMREIISNVIACFLAS